MPVQNTLAGSLTAPLYSALDYLRNLSPRIQLLLGSGVLLSLILRYLRAKRVGSALPGSQYVLDLGKVGSASESKDLWDEYDVIIVGGGTSGCALASRLSEDPNIRVLLLEAGGSGAVLVESRVPSMYGKLIFMPDHSYMIKTEPQVHARGKENFWPRAKLLGGCSSVNAQMAQYGAPGDFDEWAKVISDESWSYKNLRRYFSKYESYQPHREYPHVDVSVRGKDGPIKVGYMNTVSEASKAFIKSCVNIGIPFTPDFNGVKGTAGVSRVMTYVDEKYQRVSSETAYLTPDVLERKNLTVAIHATVTRIIFDKVDSEIHAVGVEFANEEGGKRYRAKASRDVIVAAGAVHSPHILMLSGVGPASHLQSHDIPVVLDHPGVGQHLVDHPVVDLFFKDKHSASVKYFSPTTIRDRIQLFRAVTQYFFLKAGGPLATNFGESAAFIRSDDPILFPTEKYPKQLKDSTSAKDSPDLEFFTTPFAYKEHGAIIYSDIHTFALHVYLLRPLSSGAVLLKSNNPWEYPSVNPNYLQKQEDLWKLVRGVRALLKIAHTEPLASHLDHSCTRSDLDHQTHLKSDEELAELVKDRVETVYHPAKTCRMAPREEGGVVDAKLRVYGIKGLRVCDASIFPSIVSGHTAGACFAIAEKLAEELKSEYRSK